MSYKPDQNEETFEINEPLDERGRDLWAAAQALSEQAEQESTPSDYEPLAPPGQDYYYDNSTNTQDLTDALRLAAEEGTIGSDLWERAMAMSQAEAQRARERAAAEAAAAAAAPPAPEPQPEPETYSIPEPQPEPEPEPARTSTAKELEPFDQEQARARVRQQQEEVRAARAAQRQHAGFPAPPAGNTPEAEAETPKRPAPRPQPPRGKNMADKLRPPQEDKPLSAKERRKRAKEQAKKAKAAEQAKKDAAKAAKKGKKPKAGKNKDAYKAAEAAKQAHAARRAANSGAGSDKLPPLNRDGQQDTSSFSAVQDPPQQNSKRTKAPKERVQTTAEQMSSLSAADVDQDSQTQKPGLRERLNQALGKKGLTIGRPPEVDLLPLELQDAKRTRAVQSAAGFFLLAVVVVMVGLSLIAWQDARMAQAEQQAAEQLSTDLTAAQAQFQEARELADTVEALGAAAEAATFTHISWFDIMADLRRSIPSEVRIEALQIDSASPLEPYAHREGPYQGDQAGYIEFTAVTADLPDLAVWTRGLEDVPGFTEATAVQVEGNEDEGYEVLMQIQLEESLFAVPEVAE